MLCKLTRTAQIFGILTVTNHRRSYTNAFSFVVAFFFLSASAQASQIPCISSLTQISQKLKTDFVDNDLHRELLRFFTTELTAADIQMENDHVLLRAMTMYSKAIENPDLTSADLIKIGNGLNEVLVTASLKKNEPFRNHFEIQVSNNVFVDATKDWFKAKGLLTQIILRGLKHPSQNFHTLSTWLAGLKTMLNEKQDVFDNLATQEIQKEALAMLKKFNDDSGFDGLYLPWLATLKRRGLLTDDELSQLLKSRLSYLSSRPEFDKYVFVYGLRIEFGSTFDSVKFLGL